MIIKLGSMKKKAHKVLRSADFEVKRLNRMLDAIEPDHKDRQSCLNGIQNALKSQSDHVVFRKKVSERRDQMINDTLSSIAKEIDESRLTMEDINIEWEINPLIIGGASNGVEDDYYKISETLCVKHNLPVDPNQDANFQQDMAMRKQQQEACRCMNKELPSEDIRQVQMEVAKGLKWSTSIDERLDKILHQIEAESCDMTGKENE